MQPISKDIYLPIQLSSLSVDGSGWKDYSLCSHFEYLEHFGIPTKWIYQCLPEKFVSLLIFERKASFKSVEVECDRIAKSILTLNDTRDNAFTHHLLRSYKDRVDEGFLKRIRDMEKREIEDSIRTDKFWYEYMKDTDDKEYVKFLKEELSEHISQYKEWNSKKEKGKKENGS